jgi:hypothetical protein
MKHLNTYDEMLNEGLISDFFKRNFNKIKSIVENKFRKLSKEDLQEIKIALLPYKNLSYKEIKQKIEFKIQNSINEAEDHSKIDPYGEEEWDERRDNREYKFRKILGILNLIFASTAIINFFTSLGLAIFVKENIDWVNTTINITFITAFVSLMLWMLTGGPRTLFNYLP